MVMQEDFLHYIWQYQKIDSDNLKTVNGQDLQVLSVGQLNHNSGPDFFNARIVIQHQEWAGNVEVHVKASDWYAHHHEIDRNYDNVILHVVWEDDVVVFNACNKPVQTLELKKYVDTSFVGNYKALLAGKKWINCQSDIHTVDSITLMSLKDSLLVSRLERKSKEIETRLKATHFNWEGVLFEKITKAFGLKVNAVIFEQLAKSISFTVFKKEMSSTLKLEALLYGQANMLQDDLHDSYYVELKKEYAFLRNKYKLNPVIGRMQFFRMRPVGFPTIRLSQLAMLYYRHKNLFSRLVKLKSVEEIRKIFNLTTSTYWKTHYTFGKEGSSRTKKLSNSFVDILILNVLLPIKYVYFRLIGQGSNKAVLEMYKHIAPESNAVIHKFKAFNLQIEHAGDTQALLELKNHYCDKNKCLSCKIGNRLLYR